jgi:hypothetical protein
LRGTHRSGPGAQPSIGFVSNAVQPSTQAQALRHAHGENHRRCRRAQRGLQCAYDRVTISDDYGIRARSAASFFERFGDAFFAQCVHLVAVLDDTPFDLSLEDARARASPSTCGRRCRRISR